MLTATVKGLENKFLVGKMAMFMAAAEKHR